MASSDIVVLMPLVRTNFGRHIRRVSGERGLRWHPCTGKGQASITAAIRHAAVIAADG